MFQTVSERFGKGACWFAGQKDAEGNWEINFENASAELNEASRRDEPLLVCGTAFSFVHLCDFLKGKIVKLPAGSRVFETGGYKGRSRSMSKEELHAMITDRLGVPDRFIISEY